MTTAAPANQTNKAPVAKHTVLGSPFSPITVSVTRAAELVGLGKSTVWKLIAGNKVGKINTQRVAPPSSSERDRIRAARLSGADTDRVSQGAPASSSRHF
jgi:hypothetical protein